MCFFKNTNNKNKINNKSDQKMIAKIAPKPKFRFILWL
ncbi:HYPOTHETICAL PROTEIN MCJ_002420 [Mesomycoplasma conjunctivae]|uniref:Uncharacterized protein n=1 Tax=Mesomycoplasma conjunctivae (strain ATCC 25834 / NCTC 10147 / HRC/581) TaxID=572263 RepID=C5J641_MESCH|nr:HYPOTHETICAL PROTEIN MCJ_002420 [Mesomycoplasma conjunctivae]